MGPFLPDIRNACSANSSSSFTLNTAESVDSIFGLLTAWVGSSRTAICDPNADDRVSVLRGSSANYPNTHVHTIVGADEVTRGFGLWILASNLEWFHGITSKSKTRWLRAGIAHNNMYQDMRRLLKLAPNESPSDEPNGLTPVCPMASSPVVSPPVVEKKITYSVNGCYETVSSLRAKYYKAGSRVTLKMILIHVSKLLELRHVQRLHIPNLRMMIGNFQTAPGLPP